MVKPSTSQENDFGTMQTELAELLDDKTCRGIRAHIFSRLPAIIETVERVKNIVRDLSKQDMRFGQADALMWATYWLIWQGRESVSDAEALELLTGVYAAKPEEPRRNESVEMIERLMDQQVQIGGDFRRLMSIREACYHSRDGELDGEQTMSTMRTEITQSLGRIGIRAADDGICIASKHHEVEKIVGSRDYNRLLWRHPDLVDKSRRIRIAGGQRTCCVIGGVLEDQVDPWDRPAPERTDDIAEGY